MDHKQLALWNHDDREEPRLWSQLSDDDRLDVVQGYARLMVQNARASVTPQPGENNGNSNNR